MPSGEAGPAIAQEARIEKKEGAWPRRRHLASSDDVSTREMARRAILPAGARSRNFCRDDEIGLAILHLICIVAAEPADRPADAHIFLIYGTRLFQGRHRRTPAAAANHRRCWRVALISATTILSGKSLMLAPGEAAVAIFIYAA